MKLYTVYCIITADINKKQNYVLSTKENEIELPVVELHNPQTMHNEIRYYAKKMFDDNMIRFIEEVLVSYIDIQSDLVSKYIDTLNKDNSFDIANSLFLLCGIVIEQKNCKNTYWNKYDFTQNAFHNPLFSIIDRTIQKSLL